MARLPGPQHLQVQYFNCREHRLTFLESDDLAVFTTLLLGPPQAKLTLKVQAPPSHPLLALTGSLWVSSAAAGVWLEGEFPGSHWGAQLGVVVLGSGQGGRGPC